MRMLLDRDKLQFLDHHKQERNYSIQYKKKGAPYHCCFHLANNLIVQERTELDTSIKAISI